MTDDDTETTEKVIDLMGALKKALADDNLRQAIAWAEKTLAAYDDPTVELRVRRVYIEALLAAVRGRGEAVAKAEAEVAHLRGVLMELFPASEGFGEEMDDLIDAGLLVRVPADQEFRDEFGDEEMFSWAWSDYAKQHAAPPVQENET